MLISCFSCNSKYLLNSADLKPSGRTVKCANCGYQWFEENISKGPFDTASLKNMSTGVIVIHYQTWFTP